MVAWYLGYNILHFSRYQYNSRGSESSMKKFLLSVLIVGLCFLGPAPAEESEGKFNRVKWVTGSEVNNFGFDVFRGDNEEGPFVKVNSNTIAGAGTSDTPNRYEFIDDTIEEGKAYWYYVESISMDGGREKFTPTFKAKAKLPATDS